VIGRTAPASRRCFAARRILKPLAGSIDLGGLDIRDIAYLPQTADIDRTFPISVFDFVATGCGAPPDFSVVWQGGAG